MLIKADTEDNAPRLADSGIYLASSMAAAIEGEDAADSWFTGTIVQLGPLVNQRDYRRTIKLWLLELEDHGHDLALAEVRALRKRVEELPRDMPDPLQVGDHVCFSWKDGQQITIDGDRFLILKADEVLAVVEAE